MLEFRKAPSIYKLKNLIKTISASDCAQTKIEGVWVPARPEGYFSLRHRIKAAWLILSGKADAVTWPGDQ